jgi:hypothetical protein
MVNKYLCVQQSLCQNLKHVISNLNCFDLNNESFL